MFERKINPKIRDTFTGVPTWLLRRKELPAGAKLLYGRLAQLYSEQNARTECDQRWLANEIGDSPSTVRRNARVLAAHGLMTCRKLRFGGRLVFEFWDHPWRLGLDLPPNDEPAPTYSPKVSEIPNSPKVSELDRRAESERIERRKSANRAPKVGAHIREDSLREDSLIEEHRPKSENPKPERSDPSPSDEPPTPEQALPDKANTTAGDTTGDASHQTTPPPPTPSPGYRRRGRPPAAPTNAYEAEFAEIWWPLYPRKEVRKPALAAWCKARKGGVPAERIVNGLKRNLPSLREAHARGYCPMPTTWLNQERWEDGNDSGYGGHDMPAGNGADHPPPDEPFWRTSVLDDPDLARNPLTRTRKGSDA